MRNNIAFGVEEIFVWAWCACNVYGGERAWTCTRRRRYFKSFTHDHAFLKIYIKNHRIASHCLHDV